MVLGSSPFNRLYLGNNFCFLFLRVLRCFNSPGSPNMAMYSPYCTSSSNQWVSPFGHLRISAYLLLPVAFRCQSRPSSPISAKASTVRSLFLNLTIFFESKNHFRFLCEFKLSVLNSFFTLRQVLSNFQRSIFIYSNEPERIESFKTKHNRWE